MEEITEEARYTSLRATRVLHLNAGNMYGGVEAMLTTLARFRHTCPRMESHFALCYQGRPSQELSASGASVHILGTARISQPWTVLRARRRLREVLRARKFDLVVCHMGWSLVVFHTVAHSEGVRVALWEHGCSISRRTWLSRMVKRARPDMVVANSQYTASVVHEAFPETPLWVLHCPVALQTRGEVEKWRAAIRRDYSVANDTTVILQISRMEPGKGHMLHLEALSRMREVEGWVCWVAGGPQKTAEEKYFQKLQEAAEQLGIADRVRFLGQRNDVPQLLAAADVFCQPNLDPEGFGIVFIEALWAGRPVVTTAMGGASEIIDWSCGVLTKPGDPDSLSEVLRSLVKSPELRWQLGRFGPARAKTLCDPATQMEQLRLLAAAGDVAG